MNHEFARLMAQATRLTRAGDLSGATSAVKAALVSVKAQVMQPPGQQGAASPRDADVIEVQARAVPGHREGAARADITDLLLSDGEFLSLSPLGTGSSLAGKLFVPPQALASARALPLLVMLHGCSQTPDDFAAGTRMNELARQRGWFVLYPAQSPEANASRCWNWFLPAHQQRGSGEPELIAGLVRDALRRHAIDPHRVYAAGLSAGGAMAARLAMAYPDLFAAVGVHSGLPVGAASDLKSALVAMHRGAVAAEGAGTGSPPTIVFHGDQDSTVHPLNGDRLVANLARGAADSTERKQQQGRTYTRRIWRDGVGQVRAEHWLIHGGGHAWSGGSPAGSYSDPSGPDASAAMLDFFSTHARQPR